MNRRSNIRKLILTGCLLAAIPLIANYKPLYIYYKGCRFFPAFNRSDLLKSNSTSLNVQSTDFKNATDFKLMPLIAWNPERSDLLNSYSSPFDIQYTTDNNGNIVELPLRYRHWLGTDGRGVDVLSALIYGLRTSLLIALFAVLVASLTGIFLGALAGYYGNSSRCFFADVFSFAAALFYAAFYFFNNSIYLLENGNAWQLLIPIVSFIIIFFISKVLLQKISRKKIALPIDNIISRLMEIMISMPRLILIITLAAFTRPSLFHLSFLLGFSLWPEVARFTRAQVLLWKERDFVLAAKSLGFSTNRILAKHILKNGSGPIVIVLCFAFTNVILTEAGLSFIGVGIPSDAVTWGSLLASGHDNFSAWWLIVFPGLFIMGTVYYINRIADRYQLSYNQNSLLL
jgi:peptide/nickel transport system permease protein